MWNQGSKIDLFQYTNMANDVHLNGMRLHLDMNLIQSLNNMACTCMYTIGFLCTCLHSLLGTLGTCCIACTQCIMTPLTQGCIQLTSAPLSNSTWTHSMCPASEAFISAVSLNCNDKCISSWEYNKCQIHTTHHCYTEYTRTRSTHRVQQHIPLTLKRHHWEEHTMFLQVVPFQHTVLPHTP